MPFVVACQRHEVSHPAAQIALNCFAALLYTHTPLQNYCFQSRALFLNLNNVSVDGVGHFMVTLMLSEVD